LSLKRLSARAISTRREKLESNEDGSSNNFICSFSSKSRSLDMMARTSMFSTKARPTIAQVRSLELSISLNALIASGEPFKSLCLGALVMDASFFDRRKSKNSAYHRERSASMRGTVVIGTIRPRRQRLADGRERAPVGSH